MDLSTSSGRTNALCSSRRIHVSAAGSEGSQYGISQGTVCVHACVCVLINVGDKAWIEQFMIRAFSLEFAIQVERGRGHTSNKFAESVYVQYCLRVHCVRLALRGCFAFSVRCARVCSIVCVVLH